jgi:AbrB family looped-hinge helix DNA binding protein
MRLTSKGQVTIPQAVRDKAGLQPHSEVEFEVCANGDVLIRRAAASVLPNASPLRRAFEQVRGSANAAQFKGMGTDEFMKFIRGK